MKNNQVAAAIAVALSAVNMPILANESDDKRLVITANRIAQDINDTLADVEIIERADIERLQPQSLIDLLVNVAGVDSVQSGGAAQATSIFVRGANSNQVLILVDGIRVGSATTGNKAVANIPTSLIERIEIVKGPRAALWGSDAIGGVIQIFTRRYDAGESRLAVTMGSDSLFDIDVSAGFGSENFANTFTYNRKKSDGFDAAVDSETDEDGYLNDSIALRGDYQVSENGLIDYVIQRDRGDVEFDSSFGGNETHYDNRFWNLRYSYESADWLNQIALKSSRDHSYTDGNGISRADASVFETKREQLSFLSSYRFTTDFTLSGGLEWFNDDVEASTTGFVETERETQSAFISANYISDDWLADLAVRYDDVEKVSTETTINFGVGYRFNSNHQLSLNYGEGFKAPTFNDLYFPPPFAGNPDLDFETSDNLELVYKGSFENSQLTASIYQSDIENLIQWIPDANFNFSPQNVGEVEIEGIDLSYSIGHGDFRHQLTASHVTSEDAATGEALIRRAEDHFGYDLTYIAEKFDGYLQIEYVGERPDTDFNTFSPVTLDAYTRVNIGMSVLVEQDWRLQFKVADLFDEAPTLVQNYNPTGRQYFLTVSYSNEG